MHPDDTALDFTAFELLLAAIPGTMPLPWALGWMTAQISTPSLPQPTAGLERILGEGQLESPARAVEVLQAISAVHNQIVDRLEDGRPSGPPRSDDAFVTEWCSGYVEGFLTDREGMIDDEDLSRIFPFAAISGEAGTGSDDDPAPVEAFEEAVAAWKEQLDELVHDTHEYFRAARLARAQGSAREPKSGAGTYRRAEPKVGRNAPCPCGSGKKYKRCCGMA